MKDPVVLITGALTGIGRATALAFANEGGRIVASGRRDTEGQELVAELRKLGAEAEFLRSDVRHEHELRPLPPLAARATPGRRPSPSTVSAP